MKRPLKSNIMTISPCILWNAFIYVVVTVCAWGIWSLRIVQAIANCKHFWGEFLFLNIFPAQYSNNIHHISPPLSLLSTCLHWQPTDEILTYFYNTAQTITRVNKICHFLCKGMNAVHDELQNWGCQPSPHKKGTRIMLVGKHQPKQCLPSLWLYDPAHSNIGKLEENVQTLKNHTQFH